MKSPPVVEELFPSLINNEESTFSFFPHVGAVTSIDWSPFNRFVHTKVIATLQVQNLSW
jgi:hypothetical protein